jgi:hypothetical protein
MYIYIHILIYIYIHIPFHHLLSTFHGFAVPRRHIKHRLLGILHGPTHVPQLVHAEVLASHQLFLLGAAMDAMPWMPWMPSDHDTKTP